MPTLRKEESQRYRNARKQSGRCSNCPNPALPNKGQCHNCAEKRRRRERARTSKGICGCGQPARENRAKCQRCTDIHTRWMARPENKSRWRANVTEKNRQRRIDVLMHYGGKCVCCGESEMPFLTIDHIHNDGKKDRDEVFSGYWWRWIIKNNYPAHLQVLCWNCNMAKQHYGGGICPHQLKQQAALSATP